MLGLEGLQECLIALLAVLHLLFVYHHTFANQAVPAHCAATHSAPLAVPTSHLLKAAFTELGSGAVGLLQGDLHEYVLILLLMQFVGSGLFFFHQAFLVLLVKMGLRFKRVEQLVDCFIGRWIKIINLFSYIIHLIYYYFIMWRHGYGNSINSSFSL